MRVWAWLSCVLLVVMGAAIAAFGLLIVAQGLTHNDEGEPGIGLFFAIVGAVIALYGTAHVVAGIYVGRRRPWARWLGIALAIVGLVVGVTVLPTAFNPVYMADTGFGETINVGPSMTSILIGLSVIPYVLIVLGLFLDRRHFSSAGSPGRSG